MRTAWCLLLLLQLLFYNVKTTHVTGTWSGDEYKFLQKFAIINGHGHQIHMYGNFSGSLDATLVFVPREVWKDLNDKITDNYDNSSCQDIMRPLCDNNEVVSGYVRCLNDGCQPDDVKLVPHSQFTYSINDSTQFYYAFLSSCVPRNGGCNWTKGNNIGAITYDVWFVSGDPFTTKHNSFTYQFSYHEHGILIILIIIISLYVILLPFHLVGYTCLFGKCQMPNFVRIFTTALMVELFGLILTVTHYSLYADNGKGIQVLYDLGFFFEIFADCVLLLIVLLIAKGYRITISVIRRKRILIFVWVLYFFAVVAFIVWALFGLSIESDNNPYQEWAGGLLLAWRLVTLIYALYELRSTYLQEDDPVRVRLYIVFLVGCVVWFVYLPIVVIVAAVLNPVYRLLLISTSIRVMDFVGFLGMTILLYPRWSHRYFQFDHWFTEDEVARLI